MKGYMIQAVTAVTSRMIVIIGMSYMNDCKEKERLFVQRTNKVPIHRSFPCPICFFSFLIYHLLIATQGGDGSPFFGGKAPNPYIFVS